MNEFALICVFITVLLSIFAITFIIGLLISYMSDSKDMITFTSWIISTVGFAIFFTYYIFNIGFLK